MKETFTRASRTRRAVALMAWAALVVTAFSLWNSRISGFIRTITVEPIAFILAAFAAFVGVFAWMLYNPGRRSAAESPGLFLAMAATLFPPPIIGFCLMPGASPLRWWLALGVFLLCVIAILSHVPDEFFNVPRGRHTYLTPIPTFDSVHDSAMDPNAAWFTFNDLTRIVPDTERPSLVPRAYLQRDVTRATAATSIPHTVRPLSEVDDILGADFDVDLMSDGEIDYLAEDWPGQQAPDVPTHGQYGQRVNAVRTETTSRSPSRVPSAGTSPRYSGNEHQGVVYGTLNPEPLRIARATGIHRDTNSRLHTRETRQRLANTIRIERNGSRADTLRSSSNFTAARGIDSTTRSVFPTSAPTSLRSSTTKAEVETRKPVRRTAFDNDSSDREASARRQREAKAERQRDKELRRNREIAEQQREREQQAIAERERLSRERKEQEQRTREAAERVQRERLETERKQKDASRSARKERQQLAETESQSYRRKGRRSEKRSTQEDAPARSPVSPSRLATSVLPAAAAPLAAAALYDDTTEQPSVETTTHVRSEQTGRRSRPEVPELERTKDEYGSELVEGVMTVRFDKGQKRANLHVPFSPPLPGMPEVDCECVGGENLRLKVPVRQSYGIRIEARRSNADEPLKADVSFAAVYTPE